jgi:hypothetical protein
MIRGQAKIWSIGFILLSLIGCHSIHSDAVRDLLQQEGTKIEAAQTNIDMFRQETEARIKFLEQARSSLRESFRALQAHEAKHQSVFPSYRNVADKKGKTAYAAAYLIGHLYLVEYQRMEKAVWDQFDEDFSGLRDTADALNVSWRRTAALHAQLTHYADRSALASIDPEFVSALIEQTPGQSERLMEVLNHSRTVNDVLEEATGSRIVRIRSMERPYTFTADLVDLLDKLKKEDGQ